VPVALVTRVARLSWSRLTVWASDICEMDGRLQTAELAYGAVVMRPGAHGPYPTCHLKRAVSVKSHAHSLVHTDRLTL